VKGVTAMMYTIEFKNPVLNTQDVIGWNITTGQAGVWSGLHGERAYFPLLSEVARFMRILKAEGYNTADMNVVKV